MLFLYVVRKQTIAEFSSSAPIDPSDENSSAGHFVAVRLDEFSADSVAATAVYTRKDFYKISLITGHASYHYQGRSHLIAPGDCALVFTNAEVPYKWEVHSGHCSGYSCMFTADFLPLHTHRRPGDWAVFDAYSPSVYNLDPQQQLEFTQLFKKMLAEQSSTYKHKYDLQFLYVLECIHNAMKLEAIATIPVKTTASQITDAFKALLAGQFPMLSPLQQLELRTAQAFADQLAIHTNSLNRALKTVTGNTTTQWINGRIMQEASALLLHSNWSISQISSSLGFDEPTHFAQAFRKHTGHTPTAFRQSV